MRFGYLWENKYLTVNAKTLDDIIAGLQAYLAGRMAKKLYATASSPLEGVVR